MIKNKTYPIGHVCKVLNVKEHQLRYLERAINYDIERDEYQKRMYTDADIYNLREYLKLKQTEGYSFSIIKKMIVNSKEATEEKREEQDNTRSYRNSVVDTDLSLIVKDNNLDGIAVVQDLIWQIKSIQESVNTMNDKICKIDQIEDMNIKLDKLMDDSKNNILQIKQYGNQRDIDLTNKLIDILAKRREELEKTNNKGFFNKISKLFGA